MSKTNFSSVNGILLINKPLNKSSNAVLQIVKRLMNAKKAGHTGSLDPLATGMLPICLGEATKLSQYLLNADKSYHATGRLGIKTDSADAAGQVVQTIEDFTVSKASLLAVIDDFKGKTKQLPSMFSALKHQGTPLYKFARQGMDIERQYRDIYISRLELDGFDSTSFTLSVTCSKGTYIRNLVEDIGDRLGVGAHVTQLHRNFTSGFASEKMYHLEELEAMSENDKKQCLLPMDVAVAGLPIVSLNDDDVEAIYQGKKLQHLQVEDTQTSVRLYDHKNEFIGLGEYTHPDTLKAKRLVSRC